MEQNSPKMISVHYELYDATGDGNSLIEKTDEGRPFFFISGMGITLDEFERQLLNIEKGQDFDFTLTPDQAYGEHVEERVIDLDRQMFEVNGKFDDEHIFEGAIVPLQNEDGNRFMGRVLQINADKVKMDLNPPLAGKTLRFKGHVIENREATNQEIQQMANMLSGGGCDGCGGDCGGGCGGNCGGGCGGGSCHSK